jgi:hypothetical protein
MAGIVVAMFLAPVILPIAIPYMFVDMVRFKVEQLVESYCDDSGIETAIESNDILDKTPPSAFIHQTNDS